MQELKSINSKQVSRLGIEFDKIKPWGGDKVTPADTGYMVITNSGERLAEFGDWIVKNDDGTMEVYTKNEYKELFGNVPILEEAQFQEPEESNKKCTCNSTSLGNGGDIPDQPPKDFGFASRPPTPEEEAQYKLEQQQEQDKIDEEREKQISLVYDCFNSKNYMVIMEKDGIYLQLRGMILTKPIKLIDFRQSNMKSHAELELDILCKSMPDPNDPPIVKDFIPEILELVNKVGNSGQSGGSIGYTAISLAETVKKLCLFGTLCPLTGLDEEWSETIDGEGMLQNKRDGRVFKYADGTCVFLDAIVKVTEKSGAWSGSFWLSKEDYLEGDRSKMIHNTQKIKSFPFTPKEFYIDVIEEEVAKDDWEMYLKDPKQLEEVWQYYDRYYPKS